MATQRVTDILERAMMNNGMERSSIAAPAATNRFRDAMLVGAAIKDLPPPTPLVPPYLERDSIAALYGRSGSYKTFVALDWGMQLITSKWHLGDGSYTGIGRVLYALAEGAAGMGQRVSAWEEHHGKTISDAWRWLPLPLGLYKSSPKDVQDLLDAVVECEPDLIFVDTLSKNSVGAEENSNSDMSIVIDRMEDLRRATGATVCAVHHTGHDGKHMRGASALLGNVDTVVKCEGAEGRITLTVEKQRNMEDGQRFSLRTLKVGKSLVVVDAKDPGVEPDANDLLPSDEKALAALGKIIIAGGISSTIWMEATIEATGLSKSAFYRSVSKLLLLGLITNVGTKARPKYVCTDAVVEQTEPEPEPDGPMGVPRESHETATPNSPMSPPALVAGTVGPNEETNADETPADRCIPTDDEEVAGGEAATGGEVVDEARERAVDPEGPTATDTDDDGQATT